MSSWRNIRLLIDELTEAQLDEEARIVVLGGVASMDQGTIVDWFDPTEDKPHMIVEPKPTGTPQPPVTKKGKKCKHPKSRGKDDRCPDCGART